MPIDLIARLPAPIVTYLTSQATLTQNPLRLKIKVDRKHSFHWDKDSYGRPSIDDSHQINFSFGTRKQALLSLILETYKRSLPRKSYDRTFLPSSAQYSCSLTANFSTPQPKKNWGGQVFQKELHHLSEFLRDEVNFGMGEFQSSQFRQSALPRNEARVRNLNFVETLLSIIASS